MPSLYSIFISVKTYLIFTSNKLAWSIDGAKLLTILSKFFILFREKTNDRIVSGNQNKEINADECARLQNLHKSVPDSDKAKAELYNCIIEKSTNSEL